MKEHAWKLIPVARADPHQHAPKQFRSTISRNNDVQPHLSSVKVLDEGLGEHVTQF
jgi:hypothetical protein